MGNTGLMFQGVSNGLMFRGVYEDFPDTAQYGEVIFIGEKNMSMVVNGLK